MLRSKTHFWLFFTTPWIFSSGVEKLTHHKVVFLNKLSCENGDFIWYDSLKIILFTMSKVDFPEYPMYSIHRKYPHLKSALFLASTLHLKSTLYLADSPTWVPRLWTALQEQPPRTRTHTLQVSSKYSHPPVQPWPRGTTSLSPPGPA